MTERQRRASWYTRREQRFRARAEALAPRSRRLRALSGLCFAAAVLPLLAVLLGEAPPVALLAVLALLVAFGVSIARLARVQKGEDEAWRRRRVNERGESRCRNTWRDLPEQGSELVSPDHPYSSDLDLFGPGSLFQLINAAHTQHGQRALARFLSERAELAEVRARQEAARCLAPELALRQRLETLTLRSLPRAKVPLASLLRFMPSAAAPPRSDEEALLDWALSPPRFLNRRALLWAAWVLPPLSVLSFLASQVFGTASVLWKASVFMQVLLMLHTRRDAGQVAALVSRWQGVFARLASALRMVEELRLDAPLLQRLRQRVQGEGGPRSSVALDRFDRILGWFALRDSEWGHPPLNVLLSWDIHCVVALERWQRESGQRLGTWLEALGEVEALCSLAGAAYDNPEFSFPELVEGPAQLTAISLGHPLLAPEARVTSDVSLPVPGRALLITGSNMSGKSTLLRAMGLASVMALAGGPVCAASLRLSPLSVHTSLRVTDSLSEGVSRFYAELRRLRALLGASREATPVLFLIDEVLSGTNSVERGIGARWVLAELLRAGAIGATSTHDSALCRLPSALMERVEQAHFRESVEEGRLVFDYRLRPGPVSGGNALRLMRSLGLAIP